MKRFCQTLLRGLGRIICKLMLKLEIEGMENVPPDGPLLIIGNHFSLFEGPILIIFLPYHERQIWLGAAELRNITILRILFDLFGIIPVRRGQVDRTALRRGLEWLQAGNILGIMPEGGIDPDFRHLTMAGIPPAMDDGSNSRASAELITPRPGAAYLAVRSGAPILPTAFLGTEQILDNLRRLRRTPVRVIIGPVFGPLTIDSSLPKSDRRALEDAYGDEMMRHIAALMPPENRGPYR